MRDSGQRNGYTFVMWSACDDFAQVRHEALLSAIELGFGWVMSHNQALDAFENGLAEVKLEKKILVDKRWNNLGL